MLTLRCPGKVFLLGEYSVMVGGPSMIGTVGPEFEVRAMRAGSGAVLHPFAEQSPAGLLISRYAGELGGVRFEWYDPYDTPIGVGSSSAQFALVLQAIHMLTDRGNPHPKDVLKLYWDVVGSTQGSRPSGGDVVSQYAGGVIEFRNDPFECRPLNRWNGEPDAAFILAFSGTKARTHEHLKRLHGLGYPSGFEKLFADIDAITERGVKAWQSADARTFGELMNEFQNVMNACGIADPEYARSVVEMQTWDGVLGCKGSGAQAGDCALLLIEKDALSEVQALVNKKNWQPFTISWAPAR